MRRTLAILVGLVLLGWATGTAAQGTITDAPVSFVRGPSPFDSSPGANFTGVSTPPTEDHLFETGWAFRVAGDTQEFFFPVPSTQSYVGNTSTLTWSDVAARGLFDAQEVSVVRNTGGPSGTVRMTMTITNRSASTPLTIDIFHMVDFDIQPDPMNDSVVLLVRPNHLRITDPGGTFAEYRGANAKAFLVRPFGATDIGEVLSNAFVDNFNNTGLPFGSGDFTGGFQWSATIPPSGSRAFTAILAVNQKVAEDVDGDGKADIVTGAGSGGGPHVKVFSGADLSVLHSFLAFSPALTGGARVALCDLTGDGFADLVVAAGPGSTPLVRAFDGVTGSPLPGTVGAFFPYDPAFTGGVFVACADVTGDGTPDIITAAGAGGGPHVRVFDGLTGNQIPGLLGSFFAYSPAFTGGVSVAAGDVNNDGQADIITGAGPGGGPHVRIFSGADGSSLASFFAYDPAFTGGVFVAAGDVNADGKADIITGAGKSGGPHVQAFSGADGSPLFSFFAYDPAFTGGVFVAR